MTAAHQDTLEKISRSVMAMISDLVVIIGPDGKILYASESVQHLFGYRPESLIGQPVEQFLTPHAAEVKLDLAAPPRPDQRHYQIRHQDGTWRHLEVNWQDFVGDPAVGGFLVVARDVTEEVQARRALAEQHQFYQVVLEDLPYQVAVLDHRGRYVYVNPAAVGNPEVRRGIIGLTDEEYCRWRGHDLQVAAARQRHFAEAARCRCRVSWEETMRDPQGQLRYHQRHYLPVFGVDGHLERMIGYGRDDTERRRQMTLSDRQAEVLHLSAQGVSLPVVLQQLLTGLREHFPQARSTLRLGEDAPHGSPAAGLRSPILAGTTLVGALELELPPAGDSDEGRAVLDHLAGLAGMVIERDLHLQQLEHLAYSDPLTGLMNRSAFVRALDRALMGNPHQTVIMADLKQFRMINNRHGHAAGDALLVAMARRLETDLPGSIGVARVGGNSFALLVPAHAAEQVVADLSASINKPLALRSETLHLGGAIGVAPEAEPDTPAEAILQQAEHAVYRAKQLGQTVRRYDAEEYAVELTALTLETELRQAFADRQLSLAFQPLVEARSGSLHGMEALLRWRHPERGAVSPQVFIGLAEQSDLILDLGRWVLQEACQRAAAWPGGPVRIGVNVSARQFESPRFVGDVLSALQISGLPASLLELELTENVLMNSGRGVVDVLEQLAALGVQLALDDFGTGYSSLAYLNRFPLDILKIDRAFIQGLGLETFGQKNLAIVRSTIALAHELGLQVVAEGVETAQQRDLLVDLGCDLLQGYFFAAPMPLDRAMTWHFGGQPGQYMDPTDSS
ncbi:sensor domain-containing protein [Deinococcus alpinitundrae]|uniref:sensor domain-containing protein n=1 Tax=Deinococcus alpinitundrae TaxID=468913 RepID=UPI00137AB072|nr:EAL domain-containing protein [Deinococcus alpinitundrae]